MKWWVNYLRWVFKGIWRQCEGKRVTDGTAGTKYPTYMCCQRTEGHWGRHRDCTGLEWRK